jgi:hypothetical protein
LATPESEAWRTIAFVPSRSGPYLCCRENAITAWPLSVRVMLEMEPTGVPPISIWSPLTSWEALMKRAL